MIYEGNKCPSCGSQEYNDSFKGRVLILDPEHSEIAQHLKIKNKGSYAIRL
jgi:RNA polymerase subunit RPABC4/transcription elongation factor Spt4